MVGLVQVVGVRVGIPRRVRMPAVGQRMRSSMRVWMCLLVGFLSD